MGGEMKTVYCVLIAITLAHAAFDETETLDDPENTFVQGPDDISWIKEALEKHPAALSSDTKTSEKSVKHIDKLIDKYVDKVVFAKSPMEIAFERKQKAFAARIKEKKHKTKIVYKDWTGYINKWDGPLNYRAGANTNTYLSGLASVHDNYREDRRFQVKHIRIRA